MHGKNLAAIDLGTNSCCISIGDRSGNLIYREAVTTKLGEGLVQNMCFTKEAFDRGISCFMHYAKVMEKHDVGCYRAIATASCRMAENGAEFVKEVKEKSGIELDIISPLEEATLTLKGAILNADKNKPYVLVYDLGGGSTEITLATNSEKPQIIHTISIPWGARNSSEVFELKEYSQANAEKLADVVRQQVAEFITAASFNEYRQNCCCIATSSTPLRLVSMVKNFGSYDRNVADGIKVATREIDAEIAKIFYQKTENMAQNPYIGESRADIFVAACIIFQTIYQTLQIKELTASLKGAQEAILEELKKKWQN